eukprot:184776-Chlamydomonas_euryale.AAC.4
MTCAVITCTRIRTVCSVETSCLHEPAFVLVRCTVRKRTLGVHMAGSSAMSRAVALVIRESDSHARGSRTWTTEDTAQAVAPCAPPHPCACAGAQRGETEFDSVGDREGPTEQLPKWLVGCVPPGAPPLHEGATVRRRRATKPQ